MDRNARELRASTTVDATPEEVWSVITNFRKLAAASPELVTMVPLSRGDLHPGQTYLGINRRKFVVWPTRSRIRTVQPGRELSWDTLTSGARWVYQLEGQGEGHREGEGQRTVITLRRPVPGKLTGLSNLFAKFLLGGSDSHADELEDGMRRTLDEIGRLV